MHGPQHRPWGGEGRGRGRWRGPCGKKGTYVILPTIKIKEMEEEEEEENQTLQVLGFSL